MKKFRHCTIKEYVDILSKKEPIPGGGSAAALTGALGAALISMVANYSLGRNQSSSTDKKIKSILKHSERLRKRLLELVDLDAQAYLNVVKAQTSLANVKQKALRKAREIPQEITKLCYQAVQLTPFLVEKGNKHLVGDVEAAVEMLLGAYHAARPFSKT